MADNLKIVLSTGFDFTKGNKELEKYIQSISNSKSVKLKINFNIEDIPNFNDFFAQQSSMSDKVNESLNTGNKIKKQGLGFTKQENEKLQEQLSLFQRSQSILADSSKRRYSHMGNAVRDIEEYKKSLDNLTVSNGKIINSNTGAEVSLKDLRMQFRELRNDVQNSENAITDIKMNLNKFGSWIASSTLMLGFTRGIKEMVASVNELSDAISGLQRVSDGTLKDYAELRKTSFDVADSLGVQSVDVINSMADFSKLGYDMSKALDLATASSKYMSAGELSMQEATDSLSASYAVFGGQLDKTIGKVVEATEIIDLYNEAGNRLSVTSGDIGEAMQRSANALYSANNDISESVAMISTMQKTLQDASRTGNALKTISMRLRLVDDGEEGFDAALGDTIEEITSKYGKAVEIFDKGTQSFKSTYSIVLELSEVWAKMTDAERAFLSEKIAGKQQGEAFLALMNNAEDLTKAMEVAKDSIGSVDREMDNISNTVTFKTQQLKNAFVELANESYNSDISKFFLDTATSAVQLITDLGGLPPLLTTITGLMITMKSANIADSIIKTGKSFVDLKNNLSLCTQTIQVMGVHFAECRTNGMSFGQSMKSVAQYIGVAKGSIAGLVTGIGALISVLGVAYSAYKAYQAELEEISRKHEEQVQAISKELNELTILKEKYEEISSSNKTVNEKKKELRDLQLELVKTYGAEVEGIDLVSGAYDEQLGKLDEVVNKKKELIILANKEKLENAEKEISDLMSDTKIKSDGNVLVDSSGYSELIKTMEQINEAYGKVMLETTRDGSLQFNVDNVEEYKEVLSNLVSLMKSKNAEETTWGAKALKLYDEVSEKAKKYKGIKDLAFKYDAEEDLRNIAKSLGIDKVKNFTEKEIDSIKNSFSKLNEDEDYKQYFNGYVESLQEASDSSEGFVDKVKSVGEVFAESQESYNNAIEKIATLNDVLDSKNLTSTSNINKLMKDYPELLRYIGNEAELREQIKYQIEDEKIIAVNAMRDMLAAEGGYYNSANAMSEEYYSNKILGNQITNQQLVNDLSTYFSSLGLAYENDLKNYKNMEQAKAGITEQLINKLGGAWQVFFDSFSGTFKGMSSVLEGIEDPVQRIVMGSDNPLKQRMVKELDAKTEAKYRGQFEQARSAMSGLANILDSYTFDEVSINLDDIGGSSSSGSGSKSKESKEDISDQLDQIQLAGKLLDEQISLLEEKRNDAEQLGKTDLVKDYTSQLADLHLQRRNITAEENKALRVLKDEVKEEDNIAKIQDLIQSNSLAWWQEKQDQLEEEIKLVDLRYETELNHIEDTKEALSNIYTDVKVNPFEYLEIEQQRLDLLTQQYDIYKNKLADYTALGLSDETDQVRELKNELNALNKEIIEQQLSNIDLKLEIKEVEFENAEDIKNLIKAKIEQAEFLEDTESIINLNMDSVNVTLTEIDKNAKIITELKQALSKAKEGTAEYIKYQEQLQSCFERENDLLAELIDYYTELAKRQAEYSVYGKGGKDAWDKANDDKIKALQNEKDLLNKENEELEKKKELEEKLLEIEQLKEKLANLNNQRSIQELQRDNNGNWQWNYVKDEDAIEEAQKELADKEKDYQDLLSEIAKDSKEAEIDAEIEYYQNLANEKEAEYEEQSDRYLKFYQDQLQTTINGLQDIDSSTRSGLNRVQSTTEKGLLKMKQTYTNRLQEIYTSVKKYCADMREELESVGLSSVGELGATQKTENKTGNKVSSTINKVVGSIGNIISNISRFDTGGYIGDLPSNGGLAIVDSKERVLTAQQNTNFEKLVNSLSKNSSSNLESIQPLNQSTNNTIYQMGDIVIKTEKDGKTFGREFFNELKAMM